MKIMNKIKEFITGIFSLSDHSRCYNDMEDRGIAVFQMCSGLSGGDIHTDYLSYQCIGCPYLVLTPAKVKEKKNE